MLCPPSYGRVVPDPDIAPVVWTAAMSRSKFLSIDISKSVEPARRVQNWIVRR